ncbi:ArdC family protein [Neorhizobium sp. T786]|uniref:ArdC-like ssDNA-binding domain-containing protein n=1 Tax=Pseudorhizobium xiangyangii TaxID=2883104 RepID=UPI001CFF8E3F|nr:ArdC family protein [Neorhizobium xiangyangii]MCB5204633.1 ArdC family protein [Neorhizobium xiangyangii]
MSENRTDTYQRIRSDHQIHRSRHKALDAAMSTDNIGQTFARPLRGNSEPYHSINILLPWMVLATNGFQRDRFMTYCQAQELGGQVRKDEQGR